MSPSLDAGAQFERRGERIIGFIISSQTVCFVNRLEKKFLTHNLISLGLTTTTPLGSTTEKIVLGDLREESN